MSFTLKNLPQALEALQPVISKETLEFHWGKHHAGYVTKLNGLVKGTEFENGDLINTIMKSSGAIQNCSAQHWNHSFYWLCMGPNKGGAPSGEIAKMIEQKWGSFEEFKKQFSAHAAGHFGSGWAWLVDKEGNLEIMETHDADCALRHGVKPLMTCDVWEHAQQVDQRNDRVKQVEAFWKLVDWDFVNGNLHKAKQDLLL